MPISVVARGRIVDVPAEVSSEQGPILAVSLGDAQFGEHRGVEYQIEDLTVLEVLCRGQLARTAALHLQVDQPVLVVGTLHLSKPIESWHDQDLVRITVEAETVGVDLARLALDGADDAEESPQGSQ
jgi:hypothetical protein